MVLIDTWWNVNDVNDGDKLSADSCFNRYMVECESVHLLTEAKAKGSFNRYMVECEYMKKSENNKKSVVLIDTWWNVNFTTNNIRSVPKPF